MTSIRSKPSDENRETILRVAEALGLVTVRARDLADVTRRFEKITGTKVAYYTGGHPGIAGFTPPSRPNLIFFWVDDTYHRPPSHYELKLSDETRETILHIARTHGITLVHSAELFDDTRRLEKATGTAISYFTGGDPGLSGFTPKGYPELIFMPLIIFLDIDGVLIAYPEGEHTAPQFTPRCVEAFKSIVAAVPRARVVLSSTWRLPQHVNQLHAQWIAHGFPVSLAWDSTSDTRGDPDVSRLHRRGLEIKAWLEGHPNVRRWVVLDDERMAIEPILGSERCVFTNPARGLTPDDAERAIGILLGS